MATLQSAASSHGHRVAFLLERQHEGLLLFRADAAEDAVAGHRFLDVLFGVELRAVDVLVRVRDAHLLGDAGDGVGVIP